MKKKNPWVAAVLNFVFYGAGYIYAGKRKELGIGLLIVFLVMLAETFLGTTGHLENPFDTHLISMFVLSFVVAYDGYRITEGKR